VDAAQSVLSVQQRSRARACVVVDKALGEGALLRYEREVIAHEAEPAPRDVGKPDPLPDERRRMRQASACAEARGCRACSPPAAKAFAGGGL
jgi:hypothetical protein